MLRRKISAGALRATSSPQSKLTSNVQGQLLANTARQQQGQQSASLVSAVLLNSQRRWKEETVVGLKSELKRRGLSQTGNKSALVSRLESADTSSFLPPVPALPSNLSKRTLSTSASASNAKKDSKSPTKPEGSSQNPVSTDTVNSTGPAVISQKMEAPKTEEIEAEIVDAVPGLPEIADMETKGTSGERRKVNMPSYEEDSEIEQTIPLEPDNFRSNRQLPEADAPSTPKDLPSGPKVVTVADASTYPGGGPAHAGYDDIPASETDKESKSASEVASDAAAKLVESLPSLTTVLSAVALSPLKGIHGVMKELPPIGAPKGELKDENKDYKANSEPLNGDEKKGMYIFSGIVALGLALGGDWSGKSKKKSEEHGGSGSGKDGKDSKGGNGGAAGVKGDADWEKASGAKVVGHGIRKA